MSAQIIEKDGVPEFAVLPYAEYERLLAIAEDKMDAADVLAYREAREESFPESLVDALVNGDHPIKAYRNYRQLTQQELAERIGKSKPYIAKLEAGERTGTIDVLARIAEVLEVDLDQLA
jgi:DNA-binding XRE family transcriptional regulator